MQRQLILGIPNADSTKILLILLLSNKRRSKVIFEGNPQLSSPLLYRQWSELFFSRRTSPKGLLSWICSQTVKNQQIKPNKSSKNTKTDWQLICWTPVRFRLFMLDADHALLWRGRWRNVTSITLALQSKPEEEGEKGHNKNFTPQPLL
jgi:hypothetical protein